MTDKAFIIETKKGKIIGFKSPAERRESRVNDYDDM